MENVSGGYPQTPVAGGGNSLPHPPPAWPPAVRGRYATDRPVENISITAWPPLQKPGIRPWLYNSSIVVCLNHMIPHYCFSRLVLSLCYYANERARFLLIFQFDSGDNYVNENAMNLVRLLIISACFPSAQIDLSLKKLIMTCWRAV